MFRYFSASWALSVPSWWPASEPKRALKPLAALWNAVLPYWWATALRLSWADVTPLAVRLNAYHGRNTETARTAAPSAEIADPRAERS